MRKVGPTFQERVFGGKPVSKFTVCSKYKIVDKIQLNTEVSEAHWLKDEGALGGHLMSHGNVVKVDLIAE